MAAFVEAIGIISGVLGIIQFGVDNFAEKESVGSTVRITVGLDTKDGLNNAGGDLPDVRLFNEAGGFLGIKADPGKVDSGGFGDITIDHKGNSNQEPTYALFSANNDAICIAFASITWPSGDKYSWVGDWGQQCGGSWYYSNVYISGSGVKPNCTWIDANNDQPQTGFQVHWPDFSTKDSGFPETPEEQDEKTKFLCEKGPPFKMYNYPDTDPKGITHWVINNERSADGLETRDSTGERPIGMSYGAPKHPSSARFRRGSYYPRANGTDSHSDPHANRLIIDNSIDHTAQGLCESATSLGPDFVNVAEGTFCKMADKTLWPVCDGADTIDNCFNRDLQQLVVNGLATRSTPYKNVLDWTASQ